MSDTAQTPKLEKLRNGRYVVFTGCVSGRRQGIYGTYCKANAEAELASRLAGHPPKVNVEYQQR